MAEVLVTNFNRNFTGVSATAANVYRHQSLNGAAKLVGRPLPGCDAPISVSQARDLSRTRPAERPFWIWHVRRNPEMRAAIWARTILKLPIKIVFTSAAQRYHSWYPRQLINATDAIIATTPKAAEFVPNVSAVVPHGVDTEVFFPAEDKQIAWNELGYGGTFGIATVGRIRPEKGTDRFVDAMIKFLPNHPDGRALIIGRAAKSDQAFLEKLQTRIRQAGLNEKFLFLGEITADKMPAVMRGISLLLALPRYEGYGMTPLEAMASATPFVATDAGFFREFSDNGHAGLITKPEAAADRIGEMFSTPGQLRKMSETAVEKVKKDHSILREVTGIQDVYEQLWSAHS